MNVFFSPTPPHPPQSLQPWVGPDQDLGRCFEILALVAPAHALMALGAAYALGVKLADRVTRTRMQLAAIRARFAVARFRQRL